MGALSNGRCLVFSLFSGPFHGLCHSAFMLMTLSVRDGRKLTATCFNAFGFVTAPPALSTRLSDALA